MRNLCSKRSSCAWSAVTGDSRGEKRNKRWLLHTGQPAELGLWGLVFQCVGLKRLSEINLRLSKPHSVLCYQETFGVSGVSSCKSLECHSQKSKIICCLFLRSRAGILILRKQNSEIGPSLCSPMQWIQWRWYLKRPRQKILTLTVSDFYYWDGNFSLVPCRFLLCK